MTRTIEELEARLQEAEELLNAIRRGEADALVLSGPQGDRVVTLSDADHPYRALVETMSEGAVILAADGAIVYSNDGFAAIVGLRPDQVIGAVMDRHVAPEDLESYRELLRKVERGVARGDLRLVSAGSGATVPVHVSIVSFGSGERGSLCAVITDLTEHELHHKLIAAEAVERAKRAEAEVANRRIREILGTITDSYFELDRSWRVTEINERAAENLGKTRDEVLGRSFWELTREGVAPEVYERFRSAMRDRLAVHEEGQSALAPDKSSERHIYPTDHGLSVYCRDITERKQAEEALQASEKRFRQYFDMGLIGMAITSTSKGIIEANEELCRILGYERQELLHMAWTELTHPADLARDVAQFNRVMAGEIDDYSVDKRWIRKDGCTVDSIAAIKCVRRADRSVEYFLKLVQDMTQRKKDELDRQELARRLVDAQESERRRIAIEMHDQFGQQLSALALKLAALRHPRDGRTILTEQLAPLEAIAKRLDADVDQLVWRLRPPSLDDLGLVAALESYVNRWAAEFGLHAEVHANRIDYGDLTSEIATALYRIAQEALNNVAKHGQARSAAVLLDRSAARVSLIVEDDGKGFDVARQLRSGERFGVTGMRERTLLLGGDFDIESTPGKGTTIVVRIPLPPRRDGART
jgi:two-component system sensor histidine kinase UhpB